MIISPLQVVVIASQTTTTTGSSSNFNLTGADYNNAILLLNVTAASGTSPTMNVIVQDALQPAGASDVFRSSPTGTIVFDDAMAFTQVTAAGNWVFRKNTQGTAAGNVLSDGTLSAGTSRVGPIGLLWRIKWVIAGTSPSFTWSLTAQLSN